MAVVGVGQAVRYQLSARAHASPPALGLLSCLTCGEAEDLARQTRVHHAESRRFQRSRGGSPCLPRDRRGEPPHLGKDRGPVFSSPPALSPGGGQPALRSAHRSVPCLPTVQSPSRHVRPDLWTGGDGTPCVGSLSCAECSSTGGMGRGGQAVPPPSP